MILILGFSVFYFKKFDTEKPITRQADLNRIIKGQSSFAYREKIVDWERGKLEKLPESVNFNDCFSIDFRHFDLSEFDLTTYKWLPYATFDTDTVFSQKLPEYYEPEKIMELGKNPGLGIRKLHEQGITGKGVSIAIIDSALLLEHEEYKDNLMMYELLHNLDENADMHGTAVTSIAVGKSVGVAPNNAKVYFIASTFGDYTENGPVSDCTYMAEGILRVLEINKQLKTEDKIRVISISSAAEPEEDGYALVMEAIERAKDEGVFVITCAPQDNYGFRLYGLGRELNADPDLLLSYEEGLLGNKGYFYHNFETDNTLLVPMDSRTTAFCTGKESYVFIRQGGNSFLPPWLAGMYALCLQISPELSGEEFIRLAFETGDIVSREYREEEYEFGTIVNPQRLVERVNKTASKE